MGLELSARDRESCKVFKIMLWNCNNIFSQLLCEKYRFLKQSNAVVLSKNEVWRNKRNSDQWIQLHEADVSA